MGAVDVSYLVAACVAPVHRCVADREYSAVVTRLGWNVMRFSSDLVKIWCTQAR